MKDKKSKRVFDFIRNIIQIFIILFVILVTCFILFKNSFGYTQFGKYVFETIDEEKVNYIDDVELGELLIIKEDDVVKKGDVIYYYSVVDEKYVIKSGAVEEIIYANNTKSFMLNDKTKTNVIADRLIGTMVSSYSNYGNIINVLTDSLGFFIFVLLPIILIFIYKLYGLMVVVKQEKEMFDLVLEDEFGVLEKDNKISGIDNKDYDDEII